MTKEISARSRSPRRWRCGLGSFAKNLCGNRARSVERDNGLWFHVVPEQLPLNPPFAVRLPITPPPVFSNGKSIENLVFEGGGCRGGICVGALHVLEERGILQSVKRTAGASSGSYMATFVALGLTADEVEHEMMSIDLKSINTDGGSMIGLRNLFRLKGEWGLHSGITLYEWWGDFFERRTGCRDITFGQILKRYQRELCVLVANVSTGRPERLHPKTTPNFPVRRALRMSASFPVYFSAWREPDAEGRMNCYADGGLYANFPIKSYDGWFLSLKPEDSFFNKLKDRFHEGMSLFDLDEMQEHKFDGLNQHTLGFKFADDDTIRFWLPKCRSLFGDFHWPDEPIPDTTRGLAYRKNLEPSSCSDRGKTAHPAAARQLSNLMKSLAGADKDANGELTRDELKRLLDEGRVEGWHSLFPGGDTDSILEYMDLDGNGHINVQELLSYAQRNGIAALASGHGNKRASEIGSAAEYMGALFFSLITNSNREMGWTPDEIGRTVMLNTRYISAMDMGIEQDDKIWMKKQGEKQTTAWLNAANFTHK